MPSEIAATANQRFEDAWATTAPLYPVSGEDAMRECPLTSSSG